VIYKNKPTRNGGFNNINIQYGWLLGKLFMKIKEILKEMPEIIPPQFQNMEHKL
jgi:hypothetical protein